MNIINYQHSDHSFASTYSDLWLSHIKLFDVKIVTVAANLFTVAQSEMSTRDSFHF